MYNKVTGNFQILSSMLFKQNHRYCWNLSLMNILLKHSPTENYVLSVHIINTNVTVRGDRGDGAMYDLCKTISGVGVGRASVGCQQPLRGRYVRLERQSNQLLICEILVYGYLYSGKFSRREGQKIKTEHSCHTPNDTQKYVGLHSPKSFPRSCHEQDHGVPTS